MSGNTVVVVDNKPGANGALGVEAVLRAPKDHHSFLVASDSVSLLPLFRALPWDLTKSFVPIAVLAYQPIVVVTGATSGLKTIKDLQDRARGKPDQVPYASSGQGSIQHLLGELFAQNLAINLLHIPYKGGGQAVTDVIAGQVTVAGRWISKFGAVMRADALLQAATVGNLSPALKAAQDRYLAAARNAVEAAGHRVDDYHTTSSDAKDLSVAMGGVNADTGRNIGGLRHAISLLLETRGVGLGRAHYARRVQSHVLAALAVIEAAAQEGPALMLLHRQASVATAGLACSGEIEVVVRQTEQRRSLSFLDAKSGEPRDVDVRWLSSHEVNLERARTRPCGYLIGADQHVAVQRLRALGIEVATLGPTAGVAPGAGSPPTPWDVEDFVLEADATGQRQDARGAISDSQDSIRVLRVQTRPSQRVPAPGSHYVTLNQPLAALVSAALEPDSQNSFVANRLLGIDAGQLHRVMRPPTIAEPVMPPSSVGVTK